jgi:hypothetical protein
MSGGGGRLAGAVLVKTLQLLVLAVVAFGVWGWVSAQWAGRLFPLVWPRPYLEMVSAAAVGSLAAAVVTAPALVRWWPQRWWLAALAVASPMLLLRGGDLLHFAGSGGTRILVMSVVEALLHPLAIVGVAAWWHRRRGTIRRHAPPSLHEP